MRGINHQVSQHKCQAVVQCLLAGVSMYLLLYFLGALTYGPRLGAFGAGSFGATVFVVFAAPHISTSYARNIVGGYMVSLLVGIILHSAMYHIHDWRWFASLIDVQEFIGAVAVFVAMSLMVLLGMSHPPAAGFALGLAISHWEAHVILVVLIAAVLLATVRTLLEDWFIPLFE